MKNKFTSRCAISCIVCFNLLWCLTGLQAQCVNADFSDGNFTGWTGTYSAGQCSGTYIFGICESGCSNTDPWNTAGFNQGPNNSPPSDATTQYNQIITTTAGGNDPNLLSLGDTMPMVWPGGSGYAVRMGSMWQQVTSSMTPGDGETMSYTFLVTSANDNFTYHYAVLLNDGGHNPGQQPYFHVGATTGAGDTIPYATFEVDATTADSIGGFTEFANPTGDGPVYVKPWSSVSIPLGNYIGQTVTITFVTRGCLPNGCAGTHYAYAYIAAQCGSLGLTVSSTSGCGTQGTRLTAPDGASSYSWTGPGITSATDSATVSINQPGLYTVTIISNTFVPDTFTLDTTITTISNSPVPFFSAPAVCVGSPTVFTDLSQPSGSITAWHWNFGDGITSGAENPTHTYDTAGTYAVKLIITDLPCVDSVTINVQVLPVPTSTFTVSAPACVNSATTITYTGNATNTATYTWNFAGGTATPGTGQGPQQVSWSSAGVQKVILNVSQGGCASAPDTILVSVNALPTVNTVPNQTVCPNSTVPAANFTGTGTVYNWINSNTAIGLPASGTGSIASFTAVNTGTTQITATITVTPVSNGCTGSPTAFSITIDTTPVAVISGSATGCGSVSLTATQGSNQYLWSGGSSLHTPANTFTSSGTYTVTVTSNGDCTATAQQTVTVNTLPTATITAGGSTTICQGQGVTLTASAGAGYLWSNGATTQSISATQATGYTVTVTGANNCTASSNTITITVIPVPPLNITAGGATTFCQGGSVILTADSSINYIWSNGATTQKITVTQSNNYSVTVHNLQNCPSSSSATTVTVNALPNAQINGPSTICTGLQATLTASGGTGYSWSNGLGTAASVTVQPTGTTTYVVTVTDANSCSATAAQTVSITSAPTASINGPVQSCTGSSITLTANGGNTYAWANSLGSNASITVSPTGNTTYSVTVTVGVNCSASATQTVAVYQPATSQFSRQICAGQTYFFNNQNLGTGGAYYDTLQTIHSCDSIVTLNLTVINATQTSVYDTICPGSSFNFDGTQLSTAGTYRDTVPSTNTGCDSVITLNLFVRSAPVVTIPADTTVCAGSQVTLIATSPGNTITWQDGFTNGQTVTIGLSTNFVVSVNTPTCAATDTFFVQSFTATGSLLNTNTSVCAGDTITLTASGGGAYSWYGSVSGNISTGAVATLVATASQEIYVQILSGGVCSITDSFAVVILPERVWPGDANEDLIANNYDILAIGLAYGATGPVRPNASLTWQMQCAPTWTDSFSNGTNYAFADCNGDGVVNYSDTDAISLNYGLTHARGGVERSGSLPFIVHTNPAVYHAGDTVTGQILLGTATATAGAVYGIAFTFNAGPYAVANTVQLSQSSSWMVPVGTGLKFGRQTGGITIDAAQTAINQTNVTGYGSIADFSFVVDTGFTNGSVDVIMATAALCVNNHGDTIGLYYVADSIAAIVSGINTLQANDIAVYPNPTTGAVIIQLTGQASPAMVAVVYDELGHTVLSEKLSKTTNTINLSSFAAGIYLVKITGGNDLFVTRKICLTK